MRTITTEEHVSFAEVAAVGELPADPGLGAGEAGVDAGVDRLGLEQADGEALVGVALVLYRQLPKVTRYLAYLPEGPVIDWATDDLGGVAGPDGRAPQGPGRVRDPDRSAGGHPPVDARSR